MCVREKGFSVAGLPLENAEQGPSRNEVHEDVDVSLIHAGAEIADHIPVSHTSQDLYLQSQLLILLGALGRSLQTETDIHTESRTSLSFQT